MAKVNSISWLVYVLLVLYNNGNGQSSKEKKRNHDLVLLLRFRETIDKQFLSNRSGPCTQDFNLLHHDKIFQDYSLWDNEIRTANNVANYLTSMWRYLNKNNRSLAENEATIYTLAKTIALSSEQIYGSVVCFDKYKFQGRRQFCPYAFKSNTRTNQTIVRDLGRAGDYITVPNTARAISNFTWWHSGVKSLSNPTKLKQNTVYYDTNLDNLTSNSLNASVDGKYNVTSNYIPLEYGKWTTPYYDCVGGMTWMFTYLVPFYDGADTFL